MALRRPAAPRLRAGSPGTHPAVPVTTTPQAPARPEPTRAASTPTSPTPPVPARRGPGRRAVLLAGAATAAVTSAVSAGALLSRGDSGARAASSNGGGPESAPGPEVFSDVPDDAEGLDAMRWADATGVQPALADARYSPDAVITRGDVALALHRFAGAPGVPVDGAPAPIADLGEDPQRVTALLWLHGRGALWGDAALKVHPDDPATRDCAATMLTALLRPALAGFGVTWEPSTAASAPQDVEPWSALADAIWLEAAGLAPASLTASAGAGDAHVTRADLAVMLHRANSVIADALA